MADFHFLRPFWLLTLLPAVLIWWKILKNQDSASRWHALIDSHLLKHLLVGKHHKNWLKPVHILLLCWLITAFALAGPTWQKEVSPFLDDEAGLMVLLKISKSMESTDVQPSRLERAKQKIRDLLEIRQGASTGLIVYSGSAHLVMPMTRDDRIVNTMLEDITPDLMPVEGDVLFEAIALAEHTADQSGVPASILLITDTVNQEQPTPQKAVQAFPMQFLSMQPTTAPLDDGLKNAAKVLNGPIVRLSVDSTDVEQIARRAKTELSTVNEPGQEERWRDSGYLLLPLVALCMLLWFRKGWVIL